MNIFISAYLSQAYSEYAKANVASLSNSLEFAGHLFPKPSMSIGDTGYLEDFITQPERLKTTYLNTLPRCARPSPSTSPHITSHPFLIIPHSFAQTIPENVA